MKRRLLMDIRKGNGEHILEENVHRQIIEI